MPELILASTSPARRALLDTLGIAYRVEAPGVDEPVVEGALVEETVEGLAERKARAVFARHPGAFVLGADQLVSVGSEILESRRIARPHGSSSRSSRGHRTGS